MTYHDARELLQKLAYKMEMRSLNYDNMFIAPDEKHKDQRDALVTVIQEFVSICEMKVD